MVAHDVASRVIRRLAAGCKSRRDLHSEAFPLAEHIVYAWYDEACDRQKFDIVFFKYVQKLEDAILGP